MDDRASYRMFRSRMLDNQWRGEEKRRVRAGSGAGTTFSDGRRAINAFREHVVSHAQELMDASLDNEDLVRHALRIDASVRLRPGIVDVAIQVVLFCLPTRLAARRARHLLSSSGCLEGRRYLFQSFVKLSVFGLKSIYYHDALDFGLTRLDEARSWDDLEVLDRMDIDLLRVARGLGLTKPREIRSDLLSRGHRPRSKLLWVLVSEGVIRSVEELSWTEHARSWPETGEAEEQLAKLRATVRYMMAHALDREQVAGLLRHHLMGLRPERLSENLAYLECAGVDDLSGVLKSTGDLLWRSPTATWRFVTESIGVRSPKEIARFKRVLDCHEVPSAELSDEIRALGGGLEELAACQELFTGLRPDRGNIERALARLRTLAASPHGLTIDQLAQCLRYLQEEADFAAFLQVLFAHGFGDAPSVLAFQRCFGKVLPDHLMKALTLLGHRGRGQPCAEVVAWVEAAAHGGYFDSYEYLVGACAIDDLSALRQTLKLAPLGVPFLQYLVELRELHSIQAIRRWYYRARGIDGYRSWGRYDKADLVLLDDAFTRNQFNLLKTNQDVVKEIVRQRVEDQIGPWPWQADEATRSTYRQSSEAVSARIRQDLVPMLQKVLDATGGLLPKTVFSGEKQEAEDLEQNLVRLAPLLTDLLGGQGPSPEVLSPIEADAIALVYRVPVATVLGRWREVRGREQDVLRCRLRPSYPMAWSKASWQLSRPLDRSGFAPLVAATRFAEGLADSSHRDVLTACVGLGPKQLRPGVNSTDLDTLARHLGSLLAIAKGHDVVRAWMRDGFEVLGVMDEDTLDAHQRITELCDLFDVVLPDALDQHTEAFVQSLTDDDAAHWAERLGPCAEHGSGRTRLRAVLQLAREKVIPPYRTWARRQRNRYKRDGQAIGAQTLTACVSKHPAAFFAKAGAQLCTAENVEMWREDRQFHLVVFDLVGRRMAGMALLYVQDIPELDRRRHSLVIRAINPTDEMLSGHAPASIVESYIDVAIQIAQDNDLACVAFPPPSGMHLMSNRADIEAYVKERYVERSVRQGRSGQSSDGVSLRDRPDLVPARFYAYETGKQLLHELYVIWRPDPSSE